MVGQVPPCATAFKSATGCPQRIYRFDIEWDPTALEFNFTIPVKAEGFQGPQHFVAAARDYAGGVEVLHAHQPAPAGMSCIEVATDRCNQGTQMQTAGG